MKGIALCVAGLSFTTFGVTQVHREIRPWTEEKLEAVVRVETDIDTFTVGTGFIVNGTSTNYVVTSTHVVWGRGESDAASTTCEPFKNKVDLYRRERDLEKLDHTGCAWRLGSDLSLIPLARRSNQYPALTLAAREFYQYDQVYPAGYPNGYPLDPTRSGTVSTTRTPEELVVASAFTMEGMSGGPYLSTAGYVVGVHNGGVRYRAGFAHFTSIKRARAILEKFVGPIVDEAVSKPEPELAIEESRRTAGLGSLLALRVIKDLKKRIATWEIYIGRKATPDEIAVLQILEDKPIPWEVVGLEPGTIIDISGPKETEVDLIATLDEVRNSSDSACQLKDRISLADGIIKCDGVSNLVRAKFSSEKNTPKVIVLHYTATPNLAGTVRLFSNGNVPASAHFLIDRDGSMVQMVETDRAAWHAGSATWNDIRNLNRNSIGIEFINLGQLALQKDGTLGAMGVTVPASEVEVVVNADGQETYWHKFTGPQLATAEAISRQLADSYSLEAIVGHCTINQRKLDPGPAFPLEAFGRAVLGRGVVACSNL